MELIDVFKVQQRGTGTFMVTIPVEVIRDLGIEKGDRLKVYLDRELKRIIYEIIS